VRRLALALVLGLVPAGADAQISPGELSRFHQALEGARNCQACHEAGKGVTADRCLTCHTALAARIASGQGLHARDPYRACERCHVEHQGQGFDLVFWGEAGSRAFDHALTGFPLRGRHATLSCPACHTPNRVMDRSLLARGGANLARTLLGLAAACRACHTDPHAGRLGTACDACHGSESWSQIEPGRFDHARTRFPLTGRHREVGCAGCHTAGPGGSLRFADTPFQGCASCHRDPHAGRLGARCATCHDTAGWHRVSTDRFDHSRTRFPLRGRHAEVACRSCHAEGRRLVLAHARCQDCHADRHAGQLAVRADQGRCESCHDVEGFTAVRFTVEDHARTAYPLSGAHLAVPCDGCHREVPLERLRALGFGKGKAPPGRTEQLRFASTRCGECHRDPHEGQTRRWGDCESCHRTPAWSAVTFEHSRTRFPLSGAHVDRPCGACHPGQGGAIALTGRPTDCAGCHADPHGGRFARGGSTDCARCHEATAWNRVRFDHDRETRFRLEGAHRSVPCAGCHRRHTAEGVVLRYSGLGTACTDCHAARGTTAPRGER
jgi:hypothetical protein